MYFSTLTFLLVFPRCPPRGRGEALHPEAASVLRPLRLHLRPSERPEMEGGEAGGAERDGGVHHPQQERHHRAHLPGGGSYGQCENAGCRTPTSTDGALLCPT